MLYRSLFAVWYTDPTGRGFLFDGSTGRPSGLIFSNTGVLPTLTDNVFDVSVYDVGNDQASTIADESATVASAGLGLHSQLTWKLPPTDWHRALL